MTIPGRADIPEQQRDPSINAVGPGFFRTLRTPLVINKIDLAPHVGASLEVMDRDARRMRGDRPFVFTNLKSGAGLDDVVAWLEEQRAIGLTASGKPALRHSGTHEHHHHHSAEA